MIEHYFTNIINKKNLLYINYYKLCSKFDTWSVILDF